MKHFYMENLKKFDTKDEQLNHYFSEFYVEPYCSYNLETEEVLLTKQPIYTYVVEGWYSPSAKMRYFDNRNEYIEFINELNTGYYEQDILIHYYIDTQVQEKVALVEYDNNYESIGNTSEKPEDALHSYFFTYLEYNIEDEYGREFSEKIDLKPYYLKYSFVKKINQDILFGKPSEKPAEQQIWCWKGQSGVNGSVYGYILPKTLFNSFISDVVSFYNLNEGGDWYDGSEYGMQTKNFIVYFETEQKSGTSGYTRYSMA